MDMVATDLDFLGKIYSQLRDEIYDTYKALWPEAYRIDRGWILLRYLQVHSLAAIEYIIKHGVEAPAVITRRLENEFLDIDYCIIETLADGLATRDKTMAEFYNLLCPDWGFSDQMGTGESGNRVPIGRLAGCCPVKV
jgi:hypothetical protein